MKKTKYKYEIVVDYGKPYNILVENYAALKTELRKLRAFALKEADNLPFFDVKIYNNDEIDITSQIFLRLV